jgi:ATP-binding cassette subfamily B protein
MDCGPAVLKALLEGFGIPVSYGRLREACQTDVDGTSIDTLEVVAGQLGLVAEQVMLPVDHLLLSESQATPALLVVRLPNGLTHFVLLWRRHGPLVQVMDPAVGRRWVRGREFLREVYVHTHRVPAELWHAWARSDSFHQPLARRLRCLGLGGRPGQALLEQAAALPGWRPLARLDAATRLVEALAQAGGVKRGRPTRLLLQAFLDPAREEQTIPEAFWSVSPAPAGADGTEQVLLRGAVLVRVAPGGRPAETAAAPGRAEPAAGPLSRMVRCSS